MDEPTLKQIGKYQITGLIGRGGMGVVYRALDNIGRDVAIKTLHGNYANDSDFIKRFYREARATGTLQHKNIVTIFALGDEEGIPYMVMEFLDGKSLSEIISSRLSISLADKLGLIVQACEGLHHAHQRGLVHRDIKPANVLVLKDGTVKIVDFGIARIGRAESITRTGQLIGSMYYMSPEQWTEGQIDGRSDVFSTGVMLYELLTYQRPFDGTDAAATFLKITRDLAPPLDNFLTDCPVGLNEVVQKALAKDPEERYQSAEDLGLDLYQIQQGLKRNMVEDFIAAANIAFGRENWEAAMQQLQEVLKLDRQHPQALNLLKEVRQRLQQQQRSARILQFLSQAKVAIAGREFDEALACIDEALRIDPTNRELLQLRAITQESASKNQALKESLQRGEAALYAGDLDEAEKAIKIALRIDSDNTDAQALGSVLSRELKERSNRAQVRQYIDEAREQIARQEFSLALSTLEEARSIDPADSTLRELANWALRGQQQELRRKEIEKLSNAIGNAFREENFASALLLCDEALIRFPNEASLLKLKHLAERQQESDTRRRFIEIQTLTARSLTEAGDYESAIKCLEQALQIYPGETHLEALLAVNRAELGRKRHEEELSLQRNIELEDIQIKAESAERDRQILEAFLGELRKALNDNLSIDQLMDVAKKLELHAKSGIDPRMAVQVSALLTECKIRHEKWHRDFEELEQLKIAAVRFDSYNGLVAALERARLLSEQHPNDEPIQVTYGAIETVAHSARVKHDAAVNEATALAERLDTERDPEQLGSLAERLQRIASEWPDEATFCGFAEQASIFAREAREKKKRALGELKAINEALSAASSRSHLSLNLERANLIYLECSQDGDVSGQFENVKKTVAEILSRLDSACNELKALASQIPSLGSLEEIEDLHGRARVISSALMGFEETDSLFRQITRRVEERHKDYEHARKSVASLSARAALAQSTSELETISTLCRQLVTQWQSDRGIRESVEELNHAIQGRSIELAEVDKEEIQTPSERERDSDPGTSSPDVEDALEPSVRVSSVGVELAGVDKLWRKSRLMVIGLAIASVITLLVVPAINVLPRTVEVQTLPPGASITVGDNKCSTPCKLKLTPGQHVVLAELPGFQPERQTVKISAFGRHVITLTMSVTAATSNVISEKPTRATAAQSLNDAGVPANLSTPSIHVNPVPPETQVPSKANQKEKFSAVGGQSQSQLGTSSPEVSTKPTEPAAPVAIPAPLALFEASSEMIEQGHTVTLTWQTQNATDIEIEGLGLVEAEGRRQLKPDQSTTYKLIAKGPGGEIVKSLRIEVQPIAKTAPPEATAAAGNPELQAIKGTLDRYREAYASESLDQIKRVWPEISKDQQKGLKDTFNNFNAIQLKLTCRDEDIHVGGGEAEAVCSQSFTYTQRNKVQQGPSGSAKIKLKKAGNEWEIISISSR